MLKLFKKNNTENTVITKEILKSVSVKDIHFAFNDEVNKLLESCNIKASLDTEYNDLLEKNKRLQKLGFVSTSISEKAINEENRLRALELENRKKIELIETINYFSNKYPHYKFITKDSVNKLCEKYGLIFSSVENYIGDVPDKNLIDIENFKIDIEDKVYLKTSRRFGSNREEFCNYNEYNTYTSKGNWNENYNYKNRPFTIVAPITDFNTKDMELKDNELKRKPVVKDDPIVLQSVLYRNKEHFLIVTAWGDEASDELVLNQNHN